MGVLDTIFILPLSASSWNAYTQRSPSLDRTSVGMVLLPTLDHVWSKPERFFAQLFHTLLGK